MKRSIDTLNLPINSKEDLKSLGFYNCNDLEAHLDVIEQTINYKCESLVPALEFETACDVYKDELINGFILTYNEKLDKVLQNIIRIKTVAELTGGPGSGKTQLCFLLCISVQLPKWCGGIGGQAVYIGTNRNFFSNRLRGLARNFVDRYDNLRSKMDRSPDDIDEEFILRNIHCIIIDSCIELFASLLHLDTYLENKQVKLLVIDSITQPLRQMNSEDRLSIINEFFLKIRKLAAKFDLAIVLTNDLTTRINESEMIITPSLGDSFYHMVNTRIVLERNNNGFRARIQKGFPRESTAVNFSI